MSVINADTFTDTNGTLLDAHTPDVGGAWSFINGVGILHIQSNKAAYQGGTQWVGATVNSSFANAAISAEIDVPAGSSYAYAIVFRYVDSINYWVLNIERSGGGTPQMAAYKIVAGSATALDTELLGAVSGTTVTAAVALNGDAITGYLNGVAQVSGSDSFQNTATRHGIGLFAGGLDTLGKFDNFAIDSDPSIFDPPAGQPTVKRWGGVPHTGTQKLRGGHRGGPWARHDSGIFVPRRLAA